MKINGISNPSINNGPPSVPFLPGKNADEKKNRGPAASDGPADRPLRPMRTFKGHGMLELYPANLTLAYVSGHEHGHAQKNQMDAGREGNHARQEISYSVQISPQGEVLATGGVTKSYAPRDGAITQNAQAGADIENSSVSTLLSPQDFERKIKEFLLERKKESYEKDLRGISNEDQRVEGENITDVSEKAKAQVSDFSENKSNPLSEDLKKWNLQWKISQLDGEKRELSRDQILEKTKENLASAQDPAEKKNLEIFSSPLPEEEHVDISRVGPASYYLTQRDIPNMVFTHGFGSAYEVNNILNKSQRFQSNKTLPVNFSIQSKLTKLETSALDKTSGQLKNLNDAAGQLVDPDALNGRISKTLSPERVAAKTSAASPVGKHEISISSLALPHKITSNEYSDPFAALGLSGSFKVNGYQVDVTTSDSLGSLRDKINHGEDVNKNGGLDYAEDLNGNGSLDVVEIQPAVNGNHTFIFEDADFDGTVDVSEDANGNGQLDGGTVDNGVKAEIQFNRLMISTAKTGDHSLTADDPSGLLMELGFLTRSEDGSAVEKNHIRESTSDPLNYSPSKALFSLDGVDYEKSSNEVDDALTGTTLQLKAATSEPVSLEVKNNVETSQARIEDFAGKYNSSMETINDYLAFQKTLRGNAIVQNIRAQLEDSMNRSVNSLAWNINSEEPVGLEMQKTEKSFISAFSAQNVAKAVFNNRHAVSSYRAQGEGTVYSALREAGIREKQDDTLRLESSRLTAALENFPEEIAGTLSGGRGASAKLQGVLADVLRDQGTLDLEKIRINSYGGRVSTEGKAFREAASYQASMKLASSALAGGVSAYA